MERTEEYILNTMMNYLSLLDKDGFLSKADFYDNNSIYRDFGKMVASKNTLSNRVFAISGELNIEGNPVLIYNANSASSKVKNEPEFIRLIGNEIFHLALLLKRDLIIAGNGMVVWKGKEYEALYPSHADYDNQPWRVEAMALTKKYSIIGRLNQQYFCV